MDDPINFYDRTGLAGESEETEAELADTVLNEINSTKAPSVTASEEYKKGNVEGSEVQKKRNPPKQAEADRGPASEPNRMEGLTSSTQHAAKLSAAEKSRRDTQVEKYLDKPNSKQNGKSKLTLADLGKGAFNGLISGATAGATYGSSLGPLGTFSGAIAGGATGIPIGMLYEVGSEAILDTVGVDKETQDQLRNAMGNIISKKEKRD